MIAYIVTEGSFDAHLLKTVLPKELLSEVEIVAAGGVSAVKSLARSLIVRRQVPVAVVVDADSVTPALVQERRQSVEELIESVAGNIPTRVIIAVPELEVIFFQDDSLLTHLLGYSPPQDLLALAELQPRSVLEQLLAQSTITLDRITIVNRLTQQDVDLLCKAPVIQEVVQFLESVHKTVSAS